MNETTETVVVKDRAGNDVIVNKEDAHLYDEFKPKRKKTTKKVTD